MRTTRGWWFGLVFLAPFGCGEGDSGPAAPTAGQPSAGTAGTAGAAGRGGGGGASGASAGRGGSGGNSATAGLNGGGTPGGGGSSGSSATTGGANTAGTSGTSASGGVGGAGASSSAGSAGSAASGGDANQAGETNGGADNSAGDANAAGGAEGGASSGGASGSGTSGSGGASGNGGASGGTNGSAGTSGNAVAPVFNGKSGYVEIPDADIFSEPTTGELSVEAWMRPDSLAMPNTENGYVHWMGKGVSGQHEWVSRMYQEGNSEDRENRISFYSFNLSGGLGAGSYFQDDVSVGAWIHYVGTFDDTRTYIYKNGSMRDSDLLSGYDIEPGNGTAPVRIGTRDRNSYFQGSIARVAIYGSRLSDARVAAHYAARAAGNYDATVLAEPSLVAFYKLDERTGTVAADSKGNHPGTYQGGVTLAGADWP